MKRLPPEDMIKYHLKNAHFRRRVNLTDYEKHISCSILEIVPDAARINVCSDYFEFSSTEVFTPSIARVMGRQIASNLNGTELTNGIKNYHYQTNNGSAEKKGMSTQLFIRCRVE